MGTEAAWVPYVVAAVTTAATAYNTKRTADDQDQAAAAGIREQGKTQREANARLNRTLDQTSASRIDDSKGVLGQQYLDQVQRAMQQANTGLTARGLSADFDQLAGGARAANADYGALTADLLATMDAAKLQRVAEGNAFGDTGMDLDRLSGNVRGTQHLTGLRMNGIRRNPYIDIVAGLMQGAAGGMGGGAGATVRPDAYGGSYVTTTGGAGWRNAYGMGGP